MELGHLTITKTLHDHCFRSNIDIQTFLAAYVTHQWGDLGQDDIDANNAEIHAKAGHILGKYNLPTGEDIYIETVWNADGFRHTSVHFVEEH